MKYLVMECHTGFAVLMDEESRFHKAANMHYEVGQTVTNPVLLTDDRGISVKKNTIMKIAAAAACLLMISGVGIRYYLTHRAAESVVMVIEETQYEMQLNRSGEVIRVLSSSGGQTVEESFTVKPKSAADTVNELLKKQKNEKELADGDTVEVIIEAENELTLEACKSDLKSEAAKLHLNADVQERGQHGKKHTGEQTEKPAETTTEAAVTDRAAVSEKPSSVPASGTGTEPARSELSGSRTVPHPELTAPNPPEKPESGTAPKHTLPEPANGTKPEHANGTKPEHANSTKQEPAVRPGGQTVPTEPEKPAEDPALPNPENDKKPENPKENVPKQGQENPSEQPAENPSAGNTWKRYQSPLTPPHPEEKERPDAPGHLPVREDGERILPEKPAALPAAEPLKPENTEIPAKPAETVQPEATAEPVRTENAAHPVKPEEEIAPKENEMPEAEHAVKPEEPVMSAEPEEPVRPENPEEKDITEQPEHPAEPRIIEIKP